MAPNNKFTRSSAQSSTVSPRANGQQKHFNMETSSSAFVLRKELESAKCRQATADLLIAGQAKTIKKHKDVIRQRHDVLEDSRCLQGDLLRQVNLRIKQLERLMGECSVHDDAASSESSQMVLSTSASSSGQLRTIQVLRLKRRIGKRLAKQTSSPPTTPPRFYAQNHVKQSSIETQTTPSLVESNEPRRKIPACKELRSVTPTQSPANAQHQQAVAADHQSPSAAGPRQRRRHRIQFPADDNNRFGEIIVID